MIDFTKKIINSNKFREPAITFQQTGRYCNYASNTSEYFTYWDEQKRRCLDGYTADDGDYISGYNYFYLNFCPINRSVNKMITDRFGKDKVVAVQEVAFPDFWDYDYYYFQAVQDAEESGKHLCVLKSRRKGYSYKNAAMLCRNYYLIPDSKSYVYASNKQYLTDDGILTKAWDYMDFIDKNTAWGKKRSVNTSMRKRAGFFTKDEFGNEVELGYKSEIIGVTLKDNPDVVRGKKAKLILFEEAGSFKELGAAWQIARPSVEVDGVAFGTMIAFGCVCKGSRVWTSGGNCINIENLRQEDGIIGWDTYQASIQNIENINPISQKECVQIELQSGRTIRCSKDHPLLWSTPGRTKRVPGKRFENERMKSWLWHEAQKCKIGDQVGLIDQIPVFGKNVMWEPRFIGWLIGDGSYGNNKTPVLSNCEQEILDYVHSHFDTVVEKQYITKDNQNYQEIRIKGICEQLRKLGIYGQTKGDKRLPINFNSYDEYTISELIGGLYDTDGYIHFSKKRARIVLTQCQKDILLQIQEALLHFGIHGIIRYVKPTNRTRKYKDRIISDKNGEYRLEIADVVSLGRFSQHIKLTVSRKSAALDLIYLFIQSKLPKYNKYLCGIVADKITNITDIGIQDIYNITAKEQHNYIVNGIVTHNTGGDQDSNFATLKDMFYKPKGYNCIELPNIWDENAVNSTCGFFIPQYTNMDIRDEKGNRIYMDGDGNTLRKPSLDFILNQRKEMIQNATNSVAIDRYVCERCITPSEACLEFGGNIFPKKELQEQLALLRSNKQLQNHKQIGDLIQTPDGNISWRIKKTGDITHYPLNKDDDPTGSIVIWEHPMKDAPFGLYIAGCLTPGQKVLTDKGLVNVEDVDFSYKLINRNGDFSKIINLQRYEKINEPIFTIKPAGSYRTTTFTQEHPILLSNNEFVKAKDLAKGDELVIPNRYNKVSNEYIHILKNELNIEGDNLLFWRFIGLWLGDGFNNVNKKSHDIYMAFGKNQKYEADEYSVLIDKVFNRKTIRCKSNGGQTRRFTHKDLVLFLDKHFGKYAKYKKIPEWVKYIPKDCKQSLICGYLDSDGTILKDRNRYKISFTSINLELLESFQQILYSINICSSITLKSKQGDYVIKDRIQHKQDSYLLQVSYLDVKKFKQFDCSCCIKLKRLIDYTEPLIKKKNRMTRISDDGKYIYLKIKDIQQNRYTGTVYNFECETHTYMCHDIVTHNCDPYDHDQSGTNSLGSCFIYKRIQNLESYSDIIVAEYTGRPNSADDFYENVRKLLLYYNARMMYENQNKGIFVYFANKHCDYLLADQPDIINDIVGGSKVQRKKGCHMNKQIKAWGEGLIKDWLNDTNANGKKNLYNILSEPLLEELIAYNDIINTDRVMSLMQIMIYREQLYNVVVKEKEKENKSRLLFDGPIFAQNWFNDDSPVKFNDDNVYTFSN